MNRIKILLVGTAILVTLGSLVLAFQLFNPTPPRTITMSTGPDGSDYARLAELYQDELAESGVELRLQSSEGARENLSRLKSGEADVAFVTMGTPDVAGSQRLRSLGAMFLEPLWFFTTDTELAQGSLNGVMDNRIAIGPGGSRSNAASRYLFTLHDLDPDKMRLYELEPADAIQKLRSREVDTIAIASNASSPIIRHLLAMDGVKLVDFARADAYTALFPELTKLVVPAGVGSLAKDLPATDKRIIAFTGILAIRKSLHPITQSLLLDAASRIHSAPSLFSRGGDFPQPRDQFILLSDSARAFYADGRPFLLRFLPYWLAVLVMQAMVAAIPLLGVMYPLLHLFQSGFHWFTRRRFHQAYVELRQIDRHLGQASVGQLQDYQRRLEFLEQRATALRVPVTYATTIYALKAHINSVSTKVKAALAAADS